MSDATRPADVSVISPAPITAAPADIMMMATLPRVAPGFFDDILRVHGVDLMLDAFVASLFTPERAKLPRKSKPRPVPAGVARHGQAVAHRFMARLEQVNAEGSWFYLAPDVARVFQWLLGTVESPHAVARLHLGSRIGVCMPNGRQLWFGHPYREVQAHFKGHPPQPGELGPALVPLLQYLDNDRKVSLNASSLVVETAVSLAHQADFRETPSPAQLFDGSLLALLGDPRYYQDLACPVDEASCVVDHLPRLMAHVRAQCDGAKSSKPDIINMGKRLTQLQARIDRNHEYLVSGQASRPVSRVAPGDLDVL